MNLASSFCGFAAGLTAMSVAWIYAAHNELTCPQKSLIILLSILAATFLSISIVILKERSKR